jgi:hypothetical protein
MKTLPKPIFPVGGLMMVVVVVDVVVLVGGAPVIVPDVEVVRVSLIGVPFRSPVTIAFESAPKKSPNWLLILSTTLPSPWLVAKVFICVV